MDISSKRFRIKSLGFGKASVRDRDAPYHCHSVDLADLPTVDQLAQMSESQFDRDVSGLIYG